MHVLQYLHSSFSVGDRCTLSMNRPKDIENNNDNRFIGLI